MPLLHNASLSIRDSSAILFLYPSLSHYCFMLFHAPLSIRNCCAILFLYATVTSRSPIYTRLLCRIVPVCHCYISFPSLYETAVPYCSCSCMPLLRHVPFSIRNCSVILIALLFAVHSLQGLWWNQTTFVLCGNPLLTWTMSLRNWV